MATNPDLMKAILSMDAYNRGYNPGIVLSGTKIGSALINTDSFSFGTKIVNGQTVRKDQAEGFYALAYKLSNGETVISYRGTDDKYGAQSGSDITNGWLLGSGNYKATQAIMAVEFYKDVAQSIGGENVNLQTVNISLTGHSLGGGLAGYIGALYNQEAYAIDSMDYLTAANNAHFYASLSPSDPQYLTIAKPIIDSVYNGQVPWDINQSGVTARHIDGEALESPFVRQIPSIAYDLGGNVDLDSVERHSMATFVIRSFANVEIGNEWKSASQYFWPVLYNDAFAKQIGVGRVDNQARVNGDYDDILRTIIAYSAIDEGERVFGDTAIRALYDDANELGRALSASGKSQMLVSNADEISKAFVHFSGLLALNKILMQDKTTALSGVISASATAANSTLSVDFSETTWKNINHNAMPNISALRSEILSSLAGTPAYLAKILADTQKFWGGGTADVFERIVFSTLETGNSIVADIAPSNKGTLFVGATGNDTVTGSKGQEMFYTGGGNDTINAGEGHDIILSSAGNDIFHGGAGNDTVDYSGDPGAIAMDSHSNIIWEGYGGADQLTGIENIIGTAFNDSMIARLFQGHKSFFDGGAGNDTVTLKGSFVRNDNNSLYYDPMARGTLELKNFETTNAQALVIAAKLTGPQTYETRGDNIALDYSAAKSALVFDLVAANFNPGFVDLRNGTVTGAGFVHTLKKTNIHNLPSLDAFSVHGSHYGDTYYTNWFSHAYGLYTGRGNDTVYIQPASTGGFTIYYSGGNDVYHATESLAKIRLDASISLSDITNISVVRISDVAMDAVLTIAGFGTLTVKYNDIAQDTIPVILESGGQIDLRHDFRLPSDTYTITGTGGVASTLHGTWGDDTWASRTGYGQTYYGKAGNDTLYGNDGDDTIYGGEGIDKIYGGDHNDNLSGDFGNDILDGGAGNDTLWGGYDNDILIGGAGTNTLNGEEGNDTYRLAAGSVNIINDTIGINNLEISIARSDILYALGGSTLEFYNAARSFSATITGYQSFATVKFSTGAPVALVDIIGPIAPANPYNISNGNDLINAQNAGSSVSTRLYGGDDIFRGSSYADAVHGDDGNDSIEGNGGRDSLHGGAGDDSLYGGDGDDFLYGNDGNDYLEGSAGNDMLLGNIGNDTLYGHDGNDTLEGGAGADTMSGGAGDDIYILRAGDSPLVGSQRDWINNVAGEGIDTLRLTGGIVPENVYTWINDSSHLIIQYTPTDQVSVYSSSSSPALERIEFDNGTVWDMSSGFIINDTADSRSIWASALADVIDMNAGNDTVHAEAGNDIIEGGTGMDGLWGGQGNDTYIFRAGDSALASADWVYEYVNEGTDTIKITGGILPSQVSLVKATGGPWFKLKIGTSDEINLVSYLRDGQTIRMSDTLAIEKIAFDNGALLNLMDFFSPYNPTNGNDVINASTATAGVTLNLLAGNDTFTGSNYNDSVIAGDGNDIIEGRGGNDILNGGVGMDRVTYASASTAVTVNLATTASQNTGGAGSDTISGFENLTGSAFNDTLTGDANANAIDGGAGNDVIQGGGGNDTLIGGAGVDILTYAAATSAITVNLAITAAQNTVGAGSDTISGFENLTGSNYNDNLMGDANANTINGGNGNDMITGGVGNDILNGGAGADTVNYSTATAAVTISLAITAAQNTGGAGADTLAAFENITGSNHNDTLRGSTGANTLSGGSGNDVLYGDAGNDMLYGNAGNDTIYGGLGSDIFSFQSGGGVDVIKDFKTAEGDKLDIRNILTGYDPLTKAITDFIQITTSGANSIVKIDANGLTGGTAWTQIATLENITGLTDEAALRTAGTIIA